MKSIESRIENIKNTWFFKEPAYYIVSSMCKIQISAKTKTIMCGVHGIFINPDFASSISDDMLEDCLKCECIRILLKHPFDRALPDRALSYISSNLLIGGSFGKGNDNGFKELKLIGYDDVFKEKGGGYSLMGYGRQNTLSYEDIYNKLRDLCEQSEEDGDGDGDGSDGSSSQNGGKSNGNNGNQSGQSGNSGDDCDSDDNEDTNGGAGSNGNDKGKNDVLNDNKNGGAGDGNKFADSLGDDLFNGYDGARDNSSDWDNDEVSKNIVDGMIKKISETRSWGTIPNNLIDKIMAEKEPPYDYKSILRIFRKTVISSESRLTRMKPNRRFGYEVMGRKMSYSTRLLVVCDTSGSMSNREIAKGLGMVCGFFKVGIPQIDVVQFDVNVYDSTLQKYTKKPKFMKTVSRGGTVVEDILDYVNNRSKIKYDGIVLYSDGGFFYDDATWSAGIRNNRYLFVIHDKGCYERLKTEVDKRIKITYLNINEHD